MYIPTYVSMPACTCVVVCTSEVRAEATVARRREPTLGVVCYYYDDDGDPHYTRDLIRELDSGKYSAA